MMSFILVLRPLLTSNYGVYSLLLNKDLPFKCGYFLLNEVELIDQIEDIDLNDLPDLN